MQFASGTFSSNTSNISTSATTHFIDRRPPPPQKKWVSFKKFLWDRQKHTICGRTPSSWRMAMLLIIYVSNYIKQYCVDKPCIVKQDILYQASPGVSFVPNMIKSQSPLVWFDEKKNSDSVDHNPNDLEYKQSNNPHKYINCTVAKASKPCAFHVEELGPCGTASYGYEDSKPCIYIKLNKLADWKPDFYSDDDLPNHMPNSLKMVIRKADNKNVLWLHCEGMTPSDVEHLGSITYYPLQGYNEYYFPSDTSPHYLSPVVGIKLNNVKSGYSISISCSIWAKNVNTKDAKEYSTYVQLYIQHNNQT
ncbi:hypothetical protein FQR65_LT07377 [Abscondita terminalis]|nr:hypothetical protein FQR65_LT07377 [Abscondita terminalis]